MNITAMTDQENGWGYGISTQVRSRNAGLIKNTHEITALTKKLAFDKLVAQLIWIAYENQNEAYWCPFEGRATPWQ